MRVGLTREEERFPVIGDACTWLITHPRDVALFFVGLVGSALVVERLTRRVAR